MYNWTPPFVIDVFFSLHFLFCFFITFDIVIIIVIILSLFRLLNVVMMYIKCVNMLSVK